MGIESTVLSLVNDAELLRPGMITLAQIEALIGPVSIPMAPREGPHSSPGQHLRHYRPKTPLILGPPPSHGRGVYLPIRGGPAEYAARLYDTLHELDRQSLDWIAVEPPPDDPAWAGVADRLKRAALLQ